jgi:hypothetical protein
MYEKPRRLRYSFEINGDNPEVIHPAEKRYP